VERNPVRAGSVERAADYRWSSGVAHPKEEDGNDFPLRWDYREDQGDDELGG